MNKQELINWLNTLDRNARLYEYSQLILEKVYKSNKTLTYKTFDGCGPYEVMLCFDGIYVRMDSSVEDFLSALSL